MAQINTKNATIKAIMRSRAFKDGVKDCLAGRWSPDYDANTNQWQWRYERGRAYAVVYRDRPDLLNISRGASFSQTMSLSNALREKFIL